MAVRIVQLEPGPKPTHPLFHDLSGRKFARLTIDRYAGRLGNDHAFWVQCDCGHPEFAARGTCVANGITQSCGCLQGDRNRELRQTRGRSRSPEWRVWANMKKRCLNPRVQCYPSYGGRGITVCKRWADGDGEQGGFECFLVDMGFRPSRSHSIERRDNDGPYAPENCYWATKNEQARNTRRTPRVIFNGRELTAWEWERETGIPAVQIEKRIGRGWSPERALTQPLRRRA